MHALKASFEIVYTEVRPFWQIWSHCISRLRYSCIFICTHTQCLFIYDYMHICTHTDTFITPQNLRWENFMVYISNYLGELYFMNLPWVVTISVVQFHGLRNFWYAFIHVTSISTTTIYIWT